MLANVLKFVPRISQRYFRQIQTGTAFLDKDVDVQRVQLVEEELFGRYYGVTDSSDLRKKRSARKFPQIKRPSNNSVAENQSSNPWKIVRLPLHDPTLSKFILDTRMPKRMKKNQRMIVEGKRLIREAMAAKLIPHAIFVTDAAHLDDFEEYREQTLSNSCPIYKVAQKDLFAFSSLTTPPGILAIFDRPKDIQPHKECLPITVICDNIREPSNLGSLFRVCAALPCSQVVVMKGCADPWEAKCLRGGSGGQFHIPIEYPVKWEELNGVINTSQAEIYLADNSHRNKNLQIRSLDEQQLFTGSMKDRHVFVVIGGETHGLSDEASEFVQTLGRGSVINVPMASTVESLNVASALAVILYEFRRQILLLTV